MKTKVSIQVCDSAEVRRFVTGELEGEIKDLLDVEMAINQTGRIRAHFTDFRTRSKDAQGDEFKSK